MRGTVELAGEDGVAINVSTTAAPEGGAANASIASTLARVLGVPKSRVRVAAGKTGRVKRVDVESTDVDALVARLEEVCR